MKTIIKWIISALASLGLLFLLTMVLYFLSSNDMSFKDIVDFLIIFIGLFLLAILIKKNI